jgi:hypothetical protein
LQVKDLLAQQVLPVQQVLLARLVLLAVQDLSVIPDPLVQLVLRAKPDRRGLLGLPAILGLQVAQGLRGLLD